MTYLGSIVKNSIDKLKKKFPSHSPTLVIKKKILNALPALIKECETLSVQFSIIGPISLV